MIKLQLILKRIFDILASCLGITILFPVFIIIAILIKLDSDGPIIFLQERLGKDGSVFKIYKFRTMCDDAVNVGRGIFTDEEDPRITKIGKLLRKTSLDEIPQFINIIKGQMSFVGPRPPLIHHPHKYENYTDFKIQRFKMKPGITGLAQVKGRNNLTWDERIELDVEYINNFNIMLDFKILIMTIFSVISKKGIYRREKGEKSTSTN
ncbi:sugar transferase [Paeniclostridium sordellii]|uniref:sugar transferase n=1 Tax=Paraclostridium sordellii TaxID=1505 RepID=UPI002149F9B6|nr:sugar transferase [Paeniclostridium sordellii]MCR1849927.1 sugar transferase [Paeniclostridium sordellii]